MGPGPVWACRCYQVDGVKWSLWGSTSLSKSFFSPPLIGETVIDWMFQATLSSGELIVFHFDSCPIIRARVLYFPRKLAAVAGLFVMVHRSVLAGTLVHRCEEILSMSVSA